MQRTLILLLTLLFVGCESEVTAPEDELEEGTLVLDTGSPTGFVHVSLADGGRVVEIAEAQTSTEWDLAFRRYTVKVNGGIAGPGAVAAAAVGPNTHLTAAEVTALTPADAERAFDAVTVADIAGASFREDGLVEDEGGSWFQFNPLTQTLAPNPAAAWKLRDAEGGFAVFRVSGLVMAGEIPQAATVEFRRQTAGGSLGSLSSVTVSLTTGPAYIDLSSGTAVSGTGCDWDLVVDPSLHIDVNAGCGAGTFPIDLGVDFTGLERADDAPDYGPFLAVISGAIPNTITDAQGVFWYNIEGNNRLWPTYNVFLVRRGESVYKVQVTDYYSATGASGQVTLRVAQLR